MEPIMNAISIMRSSSGSDVLCDDFQRLLARWNRKRLSPQLPDDAWPYTLERDQRMLRLEGEFMETLRSEVADEAALAPTEIGRAHVCTPVTNAHLVCTLMLDTKKVHPLVHNK